MSAALALNTARRFNVSKTLDGGKLALEAPEKQPDYVPPALN